VNAIPRVWRAAWAVFSLVLVEGVVVGLAITPAALLTSWAFSWTASPVWLQAMLRSMMLAPAYLVFALTLMVISPLASRMLGWRTPADAEMPIADLGWPLLSWVRYLACSHVVRTCAGTVFRATPVWTFYHRLNGARMGRGVYVNSLAVMDDNLLDFGDYVVIGAGVHLSGHTVEHGVVKTGAVRVGRNVTVGVGSVIGIDVTIGAGAQIGALSVVPKHRRLEGNARYGGIPAQRLEPVPGTAVPS
jgi:acetyltransferase-like isoleucine patch superfamily enzyme